MPPDDVPLPGSAFSAGLIPDMQIGWTGGLLTGLYLLKPLEGRGLASSSWFSGGVLAAAWKAVGAPCEAVPSAIPFQVGTLIFEPCPVYEL